MTNKSRTVDIVELANRIDTNERSWLPIAGHVVNVTFTLDEADLVSKALRASLQPATPTAPEKGWLQPSRTAIIEECAKAAEAEKEMFLSPQYASNQPFGSLCERFACDEVAKAIRALAIPSTERK